jgi:hypothetical protein
VIRIVLAVIGLLLLALLVPFACQSLRGGSDSLAVEVTLILGGVGSSAWRSDVA